MGDWDHIGKGVMDAMALLLWTAVIAVPLALWKLVEIFVWVCRHVSVSWGG